MLQQTRAQMNLEKQGFDGVGSHYLDPSNLRCVWIFIMWQIVIDFSQGYWFLKWIQMDSHFEPIFNQWWFKKEPRAMLALKMCDLHWRLFDTKKGQIWPEELQLFPVCRFVDVQRRLD